MAEAKPVQPFADRPAMRRHAMHGGQLRDNLVQRQIALLRQPVPQPSGIGGQFALGMVALRLWHQATTVALQDDHVVHETRRHAEMPRGLSVPASFLNERDDTAPKLHRM